MSKNNKNDAKLLDSKLAKAFHAAIDLGRVKTFAAMCEGHNPSETYGRFYLSVPEGAKASWHKMSILELADLSAERLLPSVAKTECMDIATIARILSRHNH